MNFLFRQFNQPLQMPLVTVLQQRIQQHRAQRRRKRQRQARLHAVAQPAVHHLNQRNVGFGDGLEEPVFLQEFFVLRMPDERADARGGRVRDSLALGK